MISGYRIKCVNDGFVLYRAVLIDDKILGLTLDNASNNNTLVEELEDLLEGYEGSSTRIRCFAHILNLVVKV
jgi:hypothetical protein